MGQTVRAGGGGGLRYYLAVFYAELIDYVEWGYNRDEERLPQINFGVFYYAEQAQLPLHYQLYPGSLPDVTTLKNILTYLESLSINCTSRFLL
jgi:transposase